MTTQAQTEQQNEFETPPMDAIPYNDQIGWNTGNENIMRMRWENRELISTLWSQLAHRTTRTYNGKSYLVRETYYDGKKTKPPINSEGARMVINVVLSVVNTVGSLSKIHQEHAYSMTHQAWVELEDKLILNQEAYECVGAENIQYILGTIIRPVFLQLMRAVEGHESQHSRGNLVEKRGEESYTMQNRGSAISFPWNRGGQ